MGKKHLEEKVIRNAIARDKYHQLYLLEQLESAELRLEVHKLRSLVKELLPYMMRDVDSGILMGEPSENHPSDNCEDCKWYKESLKWKKRIDAGEFEWAL
jgi:hypothetical protein